MPAGCRESFEGISDLKSYAFPKDPRSFIPEQCKELDIEFEQIIYISSILTPYAIAFRYPGDVFEPDSQDADETLRLAVEVFDFVLNKMPDDVRKKVSEQKRS